jgi:hypothetical protein
MKKIILFLVFICAGYGAFATCAVPGPSNGSTTGGCKECPRTTTGENSATYVECCNAVAAAGNTSLHKECPQTTAPINKGLIFLVIAGAALGTGVIYRKQKSGNLNIS